MKPKTKTVSCPQCGELFQSKPAMLRHLLESPTGHQPRARYRVTTPWAITTANTEEDR